MRHAILEPQNGFDLVINVTLWDGQTEWSPPSGTTAVPCPDEVGPDWTFKDFVWHPPEQIDPNPNPDQIPTPLNKVDFLRLFLQSERINIRAAAQVNAIIADYQAMLDAASVVLLTDPDIVAGIPMLEQAGLIGPGRAAQILAGEPPA